MGALLFGAIMFLAAAFLFSPLADWLSIDKLKESRAVLQHLVETRPLLCAAGFFLLCVVATAACFPAAPVLGITGGALFGLWPGLLLVLVASSIGSTIAFLDARYLLRDWVKRRFARRIDALVWAVRLVGQNADAWLGDLRTAMEEVNRLRNQVPDLG